MKAITNHKPRPILSFWDLTEKEQARLMEAHDVSMPTEEEFETGDIPEVFNSLFFRYRNYVESLSDFIRITSHGDPGWTFHLPPDHPVVIQGWQGIHQDGLGMAIKINEEDETVIVGWVHTILR